MSYESEEKATFNRALKKTEETSKKILDTYRRALKSTKKQIMDYRALSVIDPTTPDSKAQLRRLEELNTNIENIIKDLEREQNKVVRQAYVSNWENTYYSTGFNIERNVNTFIRGFDVSIGYRQVNRKFVSLVFQRSIAGQTFKDRTLRNRIVLQSQIKDQVAQAIVEGISGKELAQRLKAIDPIYAKNVNKALLTAQQELMTAYSHGQEDAINTAIGNGVEGEEIWRSTLDSRTRTPKTSKAPNHKKMDGQKRNEDTKLFRFPVSKETIKAPRIKGTGTARLSQIMRCRCRVLFLPFGILPTKRLAKMPNGRWEEINGDLSYSDWANNLKDPRSLQGEIAYRRKRDESN